MKNHWVVLGLLLFTMLVLPIISIPSCGCSPTVRKPLIEVHSEFNGKTVKTIKKDPDDNHYIFVVFTDDSIMRIKSHRYHSELELQEPH